MAFAITQPMPLYTNGRGAMLDGGKLYFGVVGANPETAPQTVWWDEGMTQPAAQPVRTAGGIPIRNGSPALLYTNSDFSLTVKDEWERLVLYRGSNEDASLAARLGTGIGAWMIGYDKTEPYVPATVGAALYDLQTAFVTFKEAGAEADGVTDDTTILNDVLTAAVTSGAKIIDGGGLTYATTAQVTVPEGIQLQNTVIQMADSNYIGLAYNDNSKLINVTVYGTGRTNQYPQAQRGIAAASPGRRNVTVRARVEDCNINFDAYGTIDSDIQVIVKTASGQTGISEGYGALFYQGASRNNILCWAIGNQRHGIYISAGSSNNKVVVFDVGTVDNFGVQINTQKDQPLCAGNTISGYSIGSAGGVVLAQQATGAADAGGGLQNNIVRDFEVVGYAAASGEFVANLYPAYIISISQVGAQPAHGNGFVNCAARGAFNSLTLGIMHIAGALPKNTLVRDINIVALCLNTGGAFVLDNPSGITRISGLNIDLLGSGVGIPGSYFNVTAGNYFSLDDVQIICPSATKVFFSGSTGQQRLGDGNSYNAQFLVTAVPATGAKDLVINVPEHMRGALTCIPVVASQSVSTSSTSQAIVTSNTGATVTVSVYNGHAAIQDITVSVSLFGLPG